MMQTAQNPENSIITFECIVQDINILLLGVKITKQYNIQSHCICVMYKWWMNISYFNGSILLERDKTLVYTHNKVNNMQ